MRHAVFYLCLGLVLAAEPRQDDEVRKEADKLQGTWSTISAEENGEPVPEKDLKKADWKWTFKGGQLIWTVKEGGKESSFKMEYTLDPRKAPKQIDLKPLERNKEYQATVLAIYSLEKDKLKVCLGRKKGGDRPTEFKTSPGSGRAVFVLRRVKP